MRVKTKSATPVVIASQVTLYRLMSKRLPEIAKRLGADAVCEVCLHKKALG